MFFRYLLILCTALNIGSFSAIAAAAGAGEPAVLQVPKSMIAELFAQPEQRGAGSMGTITINGERFDVDLICRSWDPHREPRRVFEDLPHMINFTREGGHYYYNIKIERHVMPHAITVFPTEKALRDEMRVYVGPAAGAPAEFVSVQLTRR